jgi:TPR repeat protein
VPRDYAIAAYWYERAAEQGDTGAAYILASMYEQGDGVPQDEQRALRWYVEASADGEPAARIKAEELKARQRR